jgi:hypothetical protein
MQISPDATILDRPILCWRRTVLKVRKLANEKNEANRNEALAVDVSIPTTTGTKLRIRHKLVFLDCLSLMAANTPAKPGPKQVPIMRMLARVETLSAPL